MIDVRGSVSFWLDDLAEQGLDDLAPRPSLPGRRRGGRLHRRRRLHRALDRGVGARARALRPRGGRGARVRRASAPPAGTAAGRRRSSPSARRSSRGGTAARPRAAMTAAMVDTVAEVGRAAAALGIDCDFAREGTYALDALRARGPRRRRGAGGGAGGRACPSRSVAAIRRSARRCGPRRARASIPASSCAASPAPPRSAAPGSSSAPASPASSPAGSRRPRAPSSRTGSWSRRRRGAPSCPASAAASCRSTRWCSRPSRCRRRSGPAIGLPRGATVTDFRHNLVYGQRTADDRLVFGGRGARYHFGSAIRPEYDRSADRARAPRAHRRRALPRRRRAPGSPTTGAARSGVPRDWHPFVSPVAGGRIVVAGGYVGDGVATREPRRPHGRRSRHRPQHRAHRAAVGREAAAAVGAGAAAARRASTRSSGPSSVADSEEQLSGRPSRIAAVTGRLGRD